MPKLIHPPLFDLFRRELPIRLRPGVVGRAGVGGKMGKSWDASAADVGFGSGRPQRGQEDRSFDRPNAGVPWGWSATETRPASAARLSLVARREVVSIRVTLRAYFE